MKLAYNNIKLLSPTDSFLAERRKTPYFGNNWHYHIEIELLLIIKGQGVRVVGDNMSQFGDNQLVLMGSNLPHLFRNEEDETKEVDYIVIKFLYGLSDISLFKKSILKIIVYGEASHKIYNSLPKDVSLERIEKFEDAVQVAIESAVENSVVLLSPACASFDQFDNYKERGTKFKNIVERFYA